MPKSAHFQAISEFSYPIRLNQVEYQVTKLMLEYCRGQIRQAKTIDPLYARLWSEIHSVIQGGGKRLRPYIFMLSYQAFGGRRLLSAIEVAAAWELLHTGLLVHDDIIDRDYIRHGKPNIAGQYRTYYRSVGDAHTIDHYANSAALLAGDLLLSSSFSFIDSSTFSADKKRQVTGYLQQALFRVIGGELLDSEAAAPRRLIDPKLIAAHKTASYSLQGPLLSGACLAGATQGELNLLERLGLELGIGFQLADDLLGIFGDEKKTGKSNSSDLFEEKHSMAILLGLDAMTPADRRNANRYFNEPTPRAVTELKKLFRRYDIENLVGIELANMIKHSNEILEKLSLKPLYKTAFQELSKALLLRVA